jgi:hypothetical protein
VALAAASAFRRWNGGFVAQITQDFDDGEDFLPKRVPVADPAMPLPDISTEDGPKAPSSRLQSIWLKSIRKHRLGCQSL